MTIRTGASYDVFLSHASEDKDKVVLPLAETLAGRGVRVWLDRQQLTLGDSLSRKIDEGLSESRFGAVVLSPSFFAKEWPQRELDGLVARETALGAKVILPIWHEISREEILRYSPTLAGKLAARTSDGIEAVADQIVEALGGPVDAGQIVTTADASTPPSALGPSARGDAAAQSTAASASASASAGEIVRAAIIEQRLPEIRAEVAKRVQAARSAIVQAAPAAFAPAIEETVALAAALALLAPDDPVTDLAITAPHRIFDARHDSPSAWQIVDGVTSCWPAMLANIRALGALLTRLELWPAVRRLAEHPPPPPPGAEKIYSGWLVWMEVQLARRRQGPSNAEHYRQPLRDAAQLALRIPELAQDGPDEHAMLNSVIAFDFLSRAIEADAALRAGRPVEAFPNFAHFEPRAVRPFTRRLAAGEDLTRALIPNSSRDRVLALLALVEQQARQAAHGTGFWEGIGDHEVQGAIEDSDPSSL